MTESVTTVVAEAVRRAVRDVAPDAADADPLVRPSTFADLQANVALPLGKRLRRAPREVAEEIAAGLREDRDVVAAVEVSGPGFLNVTVTDAELWRRVASHLADDDRLGVAARGSASARSSTTRRRTSPRRCTSATCGATIIGDCLARVLEHLGRRRRSGTTTSATGARSSGCSSSSSTSTPTGRGTPATSAATTASPALDALYREARAGVRRRPGVRRPRAGPRSSRCRPATRRRCGSGATSSRSPCAPSTRSTAGSACCSPSTTRSASPSTTRGSPDVVRELRTPASRSRATARSSCFDPDDHRSRRRAGAADRPQVRRRLRLRHDRPGRRSATGCATSRPTGCCTSSTRARRCTSGMVFAAAPARRLAAGRRRACATSRSAPCSARTGGRSGPAPAAPCGWASCWTRPSTGPARSSPRRTRS